MKEGTKVQPKWQPKDFVKAYESLCEEYGYRVVVMPVWIARDDGTFSLQLQSSVGQLPKR